MPIIVNLDVMLARRKVRSKELAERIGITEQNVSLLKSGKVKGVRFDTLALICEAYSEDEAPDDKGKMETRIVLRFHPRIAPVKCAVFPLLKNKEQLVAKAKEIIQSEGFLQLKIVEQGPTASRESLLVNGQVPDGMERQTAGPPAWCLTPRPMCYPPTNSWQRPRFHN